MVFSTLQIIICVYQSELTYEDSDGNESKHAVKRRSSVETFRSRRVEAQILFYAVAGATRFPVFETTNVLLYPFGTVTPSQKPVIYKGHKGGISKRNWTCVLFATEGRFHSRDMSLKTISNFVACWSRRMLRMYETSRVQKEVAKEEGYSRCLSPLDESVPGNMCRCSLDHNRTRVHVIFFRRGRSRGHNTVNCYLELADKSQYTPSLIWHNWNRLPQNSLTIVQSCNSR